MSSCSGASPDDHFQCHHLLSGLSTLVLPRKTLMFGDFSKMARQCSSHLLTPKPFCSKLCTCQTVPAGDLAAVEGLRLSPTLVISHCDHCDLLMAVKPLSKQG